MTDKPKPKANIRFLYAFCNEIKPVRAFYTDLLGMQEIGHVDDENMGWVGYDSDGLQYMVFRWDSELPVEMRWAGQPGEEIKDAAALMSFSLEYSLDDLRKLVPALLDANVKSDRPKPTWRIGSYWGWTIMDPMGNTVEIFSYVKEKPEGDTPIWG